MSLTETREFFEAYRDAFNRLDGNAVADLWHTPSAITDTRAGETSARLTLWTDDAPMRANHVALCKHYRQSGYGCADFELGAHEALGANHAFVKLVWTLVRTDGSLLQRFQTGYQLLRTAQGPKVLLCTAYEEDLAEMKPHVAQ